MAENGKQSEQVRGIEMQTKFFITIAVAILALAILWFLLVPQVDLCSKVELKIGRIEEGGPEVGINQNLSEKVICNTTYVRTTVCEMEGDVRIHGKSGNVHYVTAAAAISTSWKVKPHPRKDDPQAMADVRELNITILPASPMQCQVNHTFPAVVFSPGFFVNNYFHNFADFLAPLFATAGSLSGNVNLLVVDFRPWLVEKYKPVIDGLTRNVVIDLDSDDRVHCFRRATVGLRRHDTREFFIDPSTGLSLREFSMFLKEAFELRRRVVADLAVERPRLLVVYRNGTRKFGNLEAIMATAREVGFEVVASGGSNPSWFSRVVNSCDAIVGVHGAALTNIVFLPARAVVVQVVPFGNLLQWTRACFGEPAVELGLKYLEYKIDKEESTLFELLGRNETLLMDTNAAALRGEWRELYMDKQDVVLNLTKFRAVLSQAMELLR